MVKDKEVNHVRERPVLFCGSKAQQLLGGRGHPQVDGIRLAFSHDDPLVLALSLHCEL